MKNTYDCYKFSLDLTHVCLVLLEQEHAFEAILQHVQGPSPADKLSKHEFLAITHLVSCTLEAAQNSDALWFEPEVPAPSTNKKRHPTVQESLAPHILAHWGQENESVCCNVGTERSNDTQQRGSGTIDEKEYNYNSHNTSRNCAADSPLQNQVLMAATNSIIERESRAGLAVTEFERKLQVKCAAEIDVRV